MKDSSHRAHAAIARLEKKYGPTIGSAISGLVAIAFAREYVAHVDRAIERDQGAKREKGVSGLYAAARKAIDRINEFGAGKWHWAQQADPELKMFSDLLRWKTQSPAHDDPNSPWPEINALYEKRHMRHDSIGKLELSVPRIPKSGFLPVKPISQIPTVADMHAIAGEWASYNTYGSARRTEGMGRLDTDDPYGGFLRRKSTDSIMPMQDRDDTYAPASECLSAEHWNRFDVPRSAYAVVQVGGRFGFPDLPQLYPPLAELRLLAVSFP